MKKTKFLIVLILSFSLQCSCSDNLFNSKTILNQINEIEAINKFEVRHLQIEGECGFTAMSFYIHESLIRKIFYSYSEGCAVDDGISLLEYFDEKGNPLKVAYHSFHADNKKEFCMAGRGSANFNSSYDIEKVCAELPSASSNVQITNKFLPACDKNISNIKNLFEGSHYCYFPDANYVSTILNNELQYKKNIVKSLDYFARGSYINSIKVNMRSDPSQKSKSLGYLYPLETVKILETGPEETIEEIGKNRWYKVEVKSYVYVYQGSIYREASSGWIFGTFLHNY